MSAIDLEHLRSWIGREQWSEDTLSLRHAHLMAATTGVPASDILFGTALPPLWHWIYFLEGLPSSELGRDGHPARGGFLPPVPLSNRMWAGGDVRFFSPLPVGDPVKKRSLIHAIEHKQGRSGDLVFVTVLHEIIHRGRLAVSEKHDIVYKEPSAQKAEAGNASVLPPPQFTREFEPNSTTLFRYSALTFNGHRIHYDQDYCRQVEGYENLVIHGPLNATLLAMFAQECAGAPLTRFRYRGLRPALLGSTLTLNAAPSESGFQVWMSLAGGAVSMQAESDFSQRAAYA